MRAAINSGNAVSGVHRLRLLLCLEFINFEQRLSLKYNQYGIGEKRKTECEELMYSINP